MSCEKNRTTRFLVPCNLNPVPVHAESTQWYFGDITFSSGNPYSPPGSIFRFYGDMESFKQNKGDMKQQVELPLKERFIDFRTANHWSNWGHKDGLSAVKYVNTNRQERANEYKCVGFIQIDSTDAPTPPAALHLVLDSLRDFSPSGDETQKFKKWQVSKILDVDSQNVAQSASWPCYADNRYSFFKGGKCKIQTGALACDQEDPNTSNFTNYQVTSEFSSHQNPGRIQLELYLPGTTEQVNFEVLQSSFQQVKLLAENDQGEKAVLYLRPPGAQLPPQPPKIGDYRDGGVVFYVAPTPTDLDGDGTLDQGLVCAVDDQSFGAGWGCNGIIISGADGDGIGTGADNTSDILASCSMSGIAAELCDDYTGGGYNDWFLPSKDELNEMYQNEATINATAGANGGSGFANYFYWSSTEVNFTNAWIQLFGDGYQGNSVKYRTSRVRAVRAF